MGERSVALRSGLQGEEDNTGKGVAKDELADASGNQQKKAKIHEDPEYGQL